MVASNLVLLQGTLSRASERRTLPSGDELVQYEVTTRDGAGRADSVPVVWPDAPARAEFDAGVSVVVAGRVRRRYFLPGSDWQPYRSGGRRGGRRRFEGRDPAGRASAAASRTAAAMIAGGTFVGYRRWRRRSHEGVGHGPPCRARGRGRASRTYVQGHSERRRRGPGPRLPRPGDGAHRPQPAVLRSLGALYGHGRLADTGYVSILPVDQGIEHSAAASFAPNPLYFDPLNICRLAIEGGCNAVASTFGVLGAVSRRFAHRIPLIVKLNHNELLTYPNQYDQVMFGSVSQAFDMGAAGVGATIYFGSDHATRQLQEVSEAFAEAHQLGLFTVLWCYLRNNAFKNDGVDYSLAADLTGQANHLGVTIEADIIKQKLPENNGGYNAIAGYGKTSKLVYEQLTTDHPIDLCRWQVANCYMGRVGLINSGGESQGAADFPAAVKTAVVNKRAGGQGLITGRKAFQRPMAEGIELLNAVQDVYLDEAVTLA